MRYMKHGYLYRFGSKSFLHQQEMIRWIKRYGEPRKFIDFNKEARRIMADHFSSGCTPKDYYPLNPFKVGDKVEFFSTDYSGERTISAVDGNFVNINSSKHASGWWRYGEFKKVDDIYTRAAYMTGYDRETIKRIAQALGFSG